MEDANGFKPIYSVIIHVKCQMVYMWSDFGVVNGWTGIQSTIKPVRPVRQQLFIYVLLWLIDLATTRGVQIWWEPICWEWKRNIWIVNDFTTPVTYHTNHHDKPKVVMVWHGYSNGSKRSNNIRSYISVVEAVLRWMCLVEELVGVRYQDLHLWRRIHGWLSHFGYLCVMFRQIRLTLWIIHLF